LIQRKQRNARSWVMDALNGEPIDSHEQTCVLQGDEWPRGEKTEGPGLEMGSVTNMERNAGIVSVQWGCFVNGMHCFE